MSMRIAKYIDLPGIGFDLHPALPPSLPPVPPAPFNPVPIPINLWGVDIVNYLGPLLTGKYTKNCITEFQSDVLVGHDWGPGQLHIPLYPASLLASNMGALFLNSSHKYFLPAYSVQETPGGGALSLIGAGATPVAVTLPIFFMFVQDCWDNFVTTSGVVFHLPTTRWVGISWCDLIAGVILVVGDNLAAQLSGVIDIVDDRFGLSGLILGAINTAVGNYADAKISSGDWGAAEAAAVFALASVQPGLAPLTALLSPAAVSVAASQLASAIADPS